MFCYTWWFHKPHLSLSQSTALIAYPNFPWNRHVKRLFPPFLYGLRQFIIMLCWLSLSLSLSRLSVSVQSYCREVLVGQPILAHSCEGVDWRTSLMRSYLLLLQCPTCLVRLIWMILEIGSMWPYSCCFVECCFQDLFNIAPSILVQLLSSFFSGHLVSDHVVHPYSRTDTGLGEIAFYFIGQTSIWLRQSNLNYFKTNGQRHSWKYLKLWISWAIFTFV